MQYLIVTLLNRNNYCIRLKIVEGFFILKINFLEINALFFILREKLHDSFQMHTK